MLQKRSSVWLVREQVEAALVLHGVLTHARHVLLLVDGGDRVGASQDRAVCVRRREERLLGLRRGEEVRAALVDRAVSGVALRPTPLVLHRHGQKPSNPSGGLPGGSCEAACVTGAGAAGVTGAAVAAGVTGSGVTGVGVAAYGFSVAGAGAGAAGVAGAGTA